MKSDMCPEITILLATYNRAHLIGQTLESIVAQTYQNWRCIIVDDHSDDNTVDVIKSYVKKDSRFEYYLKSGAYKKGLSGTRNYGLDIAFQKKAGYIQFFDDDDIMHPQKLEMQIEPFLMDSSIDLTICCYRKFGKISTIEYNLEKAEDHSCNIITDDLLRSFYLNQINLNSPGPLWKSEILSKYRFNENLLYAEEREFYLRIFLNENIKYVPVNKILFWYRKHPESITLSYLRDNKFKEESMEKFRNVFLKEILKQKKAPFFLLKSYVAHGIREKKEIYITQIVSYLYKNYIFFDPKYVLLLLSTKFRFVWKK